MAEREHVEAAALGEGDRDNSVAVQLASREHFEQLAIVLFVLLAVGGTFLVKWEPYFHKGFTAFVHHSIGSSIVVSHRGTAPKGWGAALSYAFDYAKSIWQALVVGLLVGAGVQELLPRDWLLRVLGARRFSSTFLAGAIAVPSMMCTCCAAPPTVALARSRASVGAALAYWMGNPVLNPATVVFMGFVLGWDWAFLRVGMGILLVLGVATVAQRLFDDKEAPPAATEAILEASKARPDGRSPFVRWLSAVARLAAGLLPEYAVIVLALGAARAFLFPSISPGLAHSLWLVIVLAITGTLFVIPTAGEIPIIQALSRVGLGAGGVGALMITLPAVSLPSLAMVGRAMPARVLVLVAGSVVLFGLLTAGLAVALGL
jgi:uncharacterized membrane protein YraQ (UPF0718 family)